MAMSINFVLSLLLLMFLSVPVSGQQIFDLVEPTGEVTATARIAGGQILVQSRAGQQATFSRDPSLDSLGGDFIGYYCPTIDRALRFPRSGIGLMQTAGLADPRPRFINTRRAVRLRRGQVVSPLTFGVPLFFPGQLFPRHGFHPQHQLQPRQHLYPWQWYGPSFDPYMQGYAGWWRHPQSVLVDSVVAPNPTLPPVRLKLVNDGRGEVQVGIRDLQNSAKSQTMRIRPNSSADVELICDTGGKRIEQFRVMNPDGSTRTREVVTEYEPPIRYELVVHEWAMQSVSIDRTGKSPNMIEDINFQGRGIGRFFLPPGPLLQSGTIGVYSAALRQQNGGAVPPLVPQENMPKHGGRTLEDAVFEAQRAAQRRAAGN
ncbi:MAG: hypothetical protein CBE43_06040 [Rhodopirellula sp. TMED283]|nr:MAG: hypothetical protein CBE43_06040 [Rhodopirellula sp. TMED283]